MEAANAAGGRDNISVVFVPGPDFLGAESAALAEGRSRHGTPHADAQKQKDSRSFLPQLLIAAGLEWRLAWAGGWLTITTGPSLRPPVVMTPAPHIPKDIEVEASNPTGIVKALEAALPGDTILVPSGEYLGPLEMKDRVNIVAQAAARVVVRGNSSAMNDAGIAVVARGVKEGRVKGLHLESDETHPLRSGLLIADSSIEAEDIEVTGATECGVRISGDAHPLVMASNFHANSGPGVIVEGQSSPRLMDNRIADNGRIVGAPHTGIEIGNEAQPTLLHNEITHNGLPAVFPPALDEDIRAKNTVDPRPVSNKPAATKPHTPGHEEKSTKPDVKAERHWTSGEAAHRSADDTADSTPGLRAILESLRPWKALLPTPKNLGNTRSFAS